MQETVIQNENSDKIEKRLKDMGMGSRPTKYSKYYDGAYKFEEEKLKKEDEEDNEEKESSQIQDDKEFRKV